MKKPKKPLEKKCKLFDRDCGKTSCRKFDVAITAYRLDVSPSTVYRLLEHKTLLGSRQGVSGGIRVFECSIEQFEKKRAEEGIY